MTKYVAQNVIGQEAYDFGGVGLASRATWEQTGERCLRIVQLRVEDPIFRQLDHLRNRINHELLCIGLFRARTHLMVL